MLRQLLKNSLMSSGATRLAAHFSGVSATILVYHSVMDDPLQETHTIGPIIHSTRVFRRHIELIARDYHAVSLADVLLHLKGEKELPPRAVAITFDDGYSDNFEFAAPVLAEVGLPATFYIAVGSVDRQTLPWPAHLRYAFHRSNRQMWVQDNGAVWPLTTAEERDRAFLTACDDCCQLAGEAQDAFVKKIQLELESKLPADSQRLMMTWDQVRELARRGHVVGSHTVSHPNMAYVEDAALHSELADSKRRLEQELSAPVVHFCYPRPAMSPHWAARTVNASREAGYETAATVTVGPVRPGDNPLSLRRVPPTKQPDGLRWMLERTFAGRRYDV